MDCSLKHIKPVFNWIYFLLVILFLTNQLLEHLYLSHWIFRSYLDDLLVLPIILPITQVLLRLIYNKPSFKLDIPMIITAFLFVSIVFEIILPKFSTSYTSDYLDIVFYGIGGVIYWIIFKNM